MINISDPFCPISLLWITWALLSCSSWFGIILIDWPEFFILFFKIRLKFLNLPNWMSKPYELIPNCILPSIGKLSKLIISLVIALST